MKIFIGLLFLLFYTGASIRAQDYHYTQNYNAISQLNPALWGNFDEDHLDRKYRALFLYRNQWRSIKSPYVTKNTPFETYRFGADAVVLLPGLLKTNYVGIGVNVLRERAGDLNLTNQRAELGLSYNQKLDEKSFSYLCFALSPTFNQKSVELQNAYYDNQWTGKAFDPNLPTGEKTISNKFTAFDLNAGLMYRYLSAFHKLNFSAGFAMHNMLESRANFMTTDLRLQRRHIVHVAGRYRLKHLRYLYLTSHYWTQGVLKENNTVVYKTIGSMEFDNAFTYVGLGLRLVGGLVPVSNDALSLHFIQDYKDLRLALSYDLNFSRLKQASGRKGGIEITLLYYALRNTKKKVPKKYGYGKTDCPPHMKPKDLHFD